jgi:hypothetical protein
VGPVGLEPLCALTKSLNALLPQPAYARDLVYVSPAKPRVTDGARTRDLRDHNPMLCQLSYGHQAVLKFYQQAPGVQS